MNIKQEWKLKQMAYLSTNEQQHLDKVSIDTECIFLDIRMMQQLEGIRCHD